jgi:hypothetical protein
MTQETPQFTSLTQARFQNPNTCDFVFRIVQEYWPRLLDV